MQAGMLHNIMYTYWNAPSNFELSKSIYPANDSSRNSSHMLFSKIYVRVVIENKITYYVGVLIFGELEENNFNHWRIKHFT